MATESINTPQEDARAAAFTESSTDNVDASVEPQPISEEALAKEVKDKDIAHVVEELLRGQKIASVYIDARSGGVFFSGEARIKGDVVGRGQAKRKASSSFEEIDLVGLPGGSVLRENLSKVRDVYIAPSSYSEVQKVLEQKHILLLWGHARWGKWTTALHLLSALHHEEVFEINPNIDIEELCSVGLEREGGYVIDALAHDSAEKLNAFVLNQLSVIFREQHSHLVITVEKKANLSIDALDGYLMPWNVVPNRSQLLEKHLAWYLSDKRTLSKAIELSQTDSVQEILGLKLLPGEVDQLAELLANVAHGEFQLGEALARFEARARQQVEEWFKAHTELEERTFMLSVAVLNGASYQAVLEADEHLQSLIKPPPAESEVSGNNSVFSSTRSQRVREALAHLVQGYEEAEFGRSSVENIVLDNPAIQTAVLHYIWHEYDRLRAYLLTWLRDLGVHPSFDIRARAAGAVGALSTYDFGYVRKEVLLPWANHLDSNVRMGASLALGVPAWEGEHAPQVLGLLHHWSTLRNNWRLSWTSAAAYGGLVGLRFPEFALRDIHAIAQIEDLRLYGVLSRSMANLFEVGRLAPAYYLKVLNALVKWTAEPKDKIITLTGLLIFLELFLKARVEVEAADKKWLTLVWLIQQNETYQEKVTLLWRRALNTKAARKSALEVLHQLLVEADDDERLYHPLEQLIAALVMNGTKREEERLRFYLERWASHPKKTPLSAAKLLSTLNNNM